MVGNHKERGAWRATVHRVAQSQTRLKQLGTHQQVHSSHFESPGAGTHLTRHFGVLPLKLSAVSPQDLQDYSSQGGIPVPLSSPLLSLPGASSVLQQQLAVGNLVSPLFHFP